MFTQYLYIFLCNIAHVFFLTFSFLQERQMRSMEYEFKDFFSLHQDFFSCHHANCCVYVYFKNVIISVCHSKLLCYAMAINLPLRYQNTHTHARAHTNNETALEQRNFNCSLAKFFVNRGIIRWVLGIASAGKKNEHTVSVGMV